MEEKSVLAVREAVHHMGSQSALAEAIKAKQQQIWNWLSGVDVPAWACAAIEAATEGKVKAERLGPSLHWVRVPDPGWPHAGGRPCIDVLAAKGAAL